ncbi:PREDICTED: pentatricopeptide repeat-containing protein At4g30700 [Tarenaya hassleriana]|uniref:pentatricopeptide repeat-containing protein At4g30700 n=1 Tax=Tarenaya hassleriana TaxID=28532 RepID=UPI00053C7130|nr:PREDICTED: pentatricopeptide repeat-containing protein At4g30700 [Tarenaya hassleriana]
MLLRAVRPAIAEAGVSCRTRNKDLLLDLFKRSSTVSHLTQTHAQILVHGFRNDVALLTKLIQRLSDLGAMSYARDLFLSVSEPDLFLFNVVIRSFSANELPLSSISMFTHIRKFTNLMPDSFTYASAITAASGFQDERAGLVWHGQATVDGYGSDLFVGSTIVGMYCEFWRVDYARKVFDRLPHKDTILCNTMISGFHKSGVFVESVAVFRSLINGGNPRFDSSSLTSVLPSVAELQELRLGRQIHGLATKTGCSCHIFVLTGFISLYSKCGEINTASSLFREIRRPDLVAYNAMIAGYTFNGESELSSRIFKELVLSGERMNSSTLVGLIPVDSPYSHLMLSCAIHAFSLKSGFVYHTTVSTALTTVYSKLNEMASARKLFDESPDKSLASWNAMISGYTQNGLTEDAISLFKEMQRCAMSPNPVTITCILSACAQLGTLSLGRHVHDLVKNKGFKSNIFVSTALIDMYAKCGSIAEARRLFDLMPEKNVVTWNAMIFGYGLHGHGQEGLKIFNELLSSSIPPTPATFLCVLYACSHAGLVKEGDEIFHSMIHQYGFEPSHMHYACMVDILGRAGHLEKALQFIEAMPIKPGPPVWGTLLAACMTHKNTNLARTVSEKLFELDPENVGYHVLLSNIFSAERNYPQAATVRQVAKKKKLAKTPGCTLIEIGETPHVFTSGDRSHPQAKEIYARLEKLEGKMREAGYTPEIDMALHDVEEEERELMVKVHSEKLAIAFGLIATEPGTEIRIIKNLRVCLDCHSATKFISKITKRVIVVRDANRFHHFQDGVCSCGDFW